MGKQNGEPTAETVLCDREGCGQPIPPQRLAKQRPGKRRFHSEECRAIEHRKRWGSKHGGLGRQQVAAVARLRAAGELLLRGLEVFEPMRAHVGELIVRVDGALITVVVRTGHRRAGGEVVPSTTAGLDGADVVAIVLDDRSVHFEIRDEIATDRLAHVLTCAPLAIE